MSNPAPPLSHVPTVIETHFPPLRPAAQGGLALWVLGTVLAGSGCQQAVVLALVARLGLGGPALRQRLRAWLDAGAGRAAPCATGLAVATCFAPLLRWVLSWWRGRDLPLALDATTLGTRLVVLSRSVLYRGTAIPVAWAVFPDRGEGPWMPALTRLLALLAPVAPREMVVLLLTDQGLWSPPLWRQIQAQGWHPVMRIRPEATCAPHGHQRRPARTLVPGPGDAWGGEGGADTDPAKQQAATLLVVWDEGAGGALAAADRPAAGGVEVSWYGLRIWIELGFRTLKGLGGTGSAPGAADPERWRGHERPVGTGWCWPWPRCWPWPPVRAWRMRSGWACPRPTCASRVRHRRRRGRAAVACLPADGSGWAAISGRDGCGAACGCGPSRGRHRRPASRSPSTNRHQTSLMPDTSPCEVEPGEGLVFP